MLFSAFSSFFHVTSAHAMMVVESAVVFGLALMHDVFIHEYACPQGIPFLDLADVAAALRGLPYREQ